MPAGFRSGVTGGGGENPFDTDLYRVTRNNWNGINHLTEQNKENKEFFA